jgi:hypothetical protein
VVKAFQDLTIRKWSEYLASRKPERAAANDGLVAAEGLAR